MSNRSPSMGPTDPREPSCIHDDQQPMSMCRICQHSPELQAWHDYWRAVTDE